MALNLDFSNFNVDLSGLGDFSLDLSNLSPLLQDTTSDPSPLDIRKAEIAAEVAAKAAQQPVQPVRETADLSAYYDALRQGTTVSDIDTVGQSYDQALNEILANQGFVDTGYAEGGGTGVSKPTVSAFTAPDYAPRELGKFQGNLSAHTSSSLGQIKEFQARLEPLMAPEMARLQTQEKLDYKDAVEQAYLQNPEIQALYNEYDVKPFRATDDGSIYLYDPFTFGEIRTLEVKDNDLKKAIKAVTQIGVSILTGGAGATMGLTGAAATATSAAVSGFTTAAYGGDKDAILNSVLMAGGTSLLKGAVDKVKQGVENVAEETLQTISPELKASIPEIVSNDASGSVISKVSEEVSKAGGKLSDGTLLNNAGKALTAEETARYFDNLDQVISEVGIEKFNSPDFSMGAYLAARGNPVLADLGLATTTQEAFLTNLGWAAPKAGEFTGMLSTAGVAPLSTTPETLRTVANIERIDTATGNLIVDGTPIPVDDVVLTSGGRLEYTNPETGVTIELTTQQFPGSTTTVEADLETLLSEQRPTPVRPQPTQTPGGGGGAPSAEASAPTTTTVTAPAAPSATITPSVPRPTLTAPGSVTNALLTNTLSGLASAASTVSPPVTPIATTAPTTEPTPPTTTEPTDILEDTTAEDTAAQIETEAQEAKEAEAERLAEEARKAEEARAAAEAKAAAEQEDIAQAEARAEAAEAAREAAEAQAKADAAAAEAKYGEAVAAGEALGEARYGEGLGTGRGEGAGAGIGAGLGLGLLSGMLGGQGGTGGYTPPEFEDYDFRKTYQAPGLLELAPQYEGYQAPAAYNPETNYANTVADQIRNLRTFHALSKDQVQNKLGLFEDSLLQEAVMQNLYGAGGR
jgi:hypothetical protein